MSIPINLNLISSNLSNYITNVNLDVINANQIIKTNGTNAQYLMADGSLTNISDITDIISTVASNLSSEILNRSNFDTNILSTVNTIAVNLAAELTARAESVTAINTSLGSLGYGLATERNRIDIILTGASIDFDTLTEIVNAYQLADTSIISTISNINTSLGSLGSGLATEITAINTSLGSINSRLATEITTNVTAINTSLGSIGTSITSINTSLGSLNSGLATSVTAINTSLGSLDTSVTAINTSLGSLNSGLAAELTARAAAVTSINTTMDTLSSNIYNLNCNVSGITTIQPWVGRVSTYETYQWRALCWSAERGLFVALSSGGGGTNRVMTSPDGITWTARSAGSATNGDASNWQSVCWSKERSLFVAVADSGGTNRVTTSPDGITWTAQWVNTQIAWRGVCWSKERNLFVMVGGSNTGVSNVIRTSPDGVTWTDRNASNIRGDNQSGLCAVCWSKELSLFVAVAQFGDRVMTSPDGITWTGRTPDNTNSWISVCWSAERNLFVAGSQGGTQAIMTSPDGITWTSRTVMASDTNAYSTVCWVKEIGIFMGISYSGTSNKVIMSFDGISWSSMAASVNTNGWYGLCWAKELGIFVATAYSGSGRVMTSSNYLFYTVNSLVTSETNNRITADNNILTTVNNVALSLAAELTTRAAAVTSINTSLGSIGTSVTAINTSLGSLNSGLATERNRIDIILTGASIDFDTLTEIVNAYQLADTSILSTINNINTSLGSLNSGLATEITAINTSLGTSVTAINTSLGSLGTSVTAINTSLGSIGTSVTAINTSLGSLSTSVTDLEVKTLNQSSTNTSTIFSGIDGILTSKLDIASDGTLSIGTDTQTALIIGKNTSATNIRGSSIITNCNFTPVTSNTGSIGTSLINYNSGYFTSLNATALNGITTTPLLIGNAVPHTGVQIGRGGTNTLINCKFIHFGTVPYLNASFVDSNATNSRMVLAKYLMPVNNNVNVGTVVLNSVSGGMGVLYSLANEQQLGSTWRYKFNGVAINPASTNSLSLQLVHANGTQTISTWTYGVSTPANANFNGEIILFFTTVGASVSPQVSGYVNFVGGTTVSLQNITVSTFNPGYNTTMINSNNFQIVASPDTGFQYTVSNFTCEHLR
jgi:hypothetical protein